MKDKIIKLCDAKEEIKYWVQDTKKSNRYVPLSIKEIVKRIPGYSMLNEKARGKELDAYLRDCKLIQEADEPAYLENTKNHIELDYRFTVSQLMKLVQLFENQEVGVRCLGYILAGLRATELRELAPEVHFAVSLPEGGRDIAEIIGALVKMVVTRQRWKGKHCKIIRKALIDCRDRDQLVGRHFIDMSKVEVKVKGKVKVTTTAFYQDTVACIIGADAAFLREAMPNMEDACVFLIGCQLPEWKAYRIAPRLVSAYDPESLRALQDNRVSIAQLLQGWWGAGDDLSTRQIVTKAKQSFGKRDSRYVSVTLDPQKLRDAIVYRVLLQFLNEMRQKHWMSTEDAETYYDIFRSVFEPAPEEDNKPRGMEEPEVFVALMQDVLNRRASKIVALEEPYRKADKPIGALREIGEEPYLVMLEQTWKTEYLKAARAAKVDTSFAHKEKWEGQLQKLLCQADVIKRPSSGNRYRYDLLEEGKRDSTYVIAVPMSQISGEMQGKSDCQRAKKSA